MRTSATLLERLARVSRAAFGIVAALGAAAIWGWVLGVPALRDLGADFAPMSPAAALALVLLATSFFAAERGRPRSARLAAALAATIGVLTLAETLAGLPLGMSFHWLAPGGGEMPARLSMAACITLVLLALVTPLERERLVLRAPATSVVAAIVGAVAFFALLGLSLRVLRFDIAAPLLGFSAPAAVATMLAAIGLAAARPSEWLLDTLASKRTGAVVTRWLLPAAFVVPIAVGWMRLYAEREGKTARNPLTAALETRGAAAAGGEPALRARDGAVHPVSANAAPILDGEGLLGAVLVLREVSAQRQAERAMREAYTELDQRVVRRTAALERASAALRERNALLNAITTSTPDLIFAKDRQGRLLMANPAWSRAVGKSAEEAGSLDDNERLVLEAGETMIVEELLNTPAGERTYLTTKSPLRDEQGRVIGLIGVATDITERKHAQRELEKLVVAEQRLRAEAERANRAKDEFLAIVSHELRSPLNALKGWSHLMLTTKPLEASLVDRAAKAIRRNVDHQTRLIDDLLDTSRIVSGKLTIERRTVNLVEIVLSALDGVRPGAAAKHIDLRFTPDDTVISVVGDAGRLQQLASNLLTNAVKFTPERGAISVILHKSGERVQLQVKDNGI